MSVLALLPLLLSIFSIAGAQQPPQQPPSGSYVVIAPPGDQYWSPTVPIVWNSAERIIQECGLIGSGGICIAHSFAAPLDGGAPWTVQVIDMGQLPPVRYVFDYYFFQSSWSLSAGIFNASGGLLPCLTSAPATGYCDSDSTCSSLLTVTCPVVFPLSVAAINYRAPPSIGSSSAPRLAVSLLVGLSLGLALGVGFAFIVRRICCKGVAS